MVEIQRARLLTAMIEITAEQGWVDATVARVVERAGVSRRTFYELFDNREECFLAAFDEGIARVWRYVLEEYDPDARWAERIRRALTASLSFFDVERDIGRSLLVASLGAGPSALERRRDVLAQMITVIDEGRKEARVGADPPPLTAEGIVGGALSILHARIVGGGHPPLVELTNPLMSMIVLPYLGPAAARRELDRPVTERATGPPRSDPLRDLDIRLTYRTVRVLMSIAATPGCSNRQIGLTAGIADQGQISKLLSRLERLGLLHNNEGLTPPNGAPNAWTLSARGLDVQRAISSHAGPRE